MSSFRLAVLNLVRHRLSTTVALLSIALSVACAGVLLRLYELSGSRFSSLAHGGQVIVGAKAGGLELLLGALNAEGNYPGVIPLVLYQSLKAGSSVQFSDGVQEKTNYLQAVIPLLYFAKYEGFRVIGTDEGFVTRPDSQDSMSFSQGGWADTAGKVVLGAFVAQAKGLKVGDSIVVDRWNGIPEDSRTTISLQVSGIFQPTGTVWDNALFSNLDEARKSFDTPAFLAHSIWKNAVVNYFLIYVDKEAFPKVENLINRRTVAQAVWVPDEIARLKELTGTGRRLGFLMTVLILVLGGLGVTAMMVTRFEGLSVQLAVLRAIGYGRNSIAGWLIWEGILLGLAASLLGAILDGTTFPCIRDLLGAALPPAQMVRSSLAASAPVWLVAILATVCAVFIPLIRLYGQDIHKSLKGL